VTEWHTRSGLLSQLDWRWWVAIGSVELTRESQFSFDGDASLFVLEDSDSSMASGNQGAPTQVFFVKRGSWA